MAHARLRNGSAWRFALHARERSLVRRAEAVPTCPAAPAAAAPPAANNVRLVTGAPYSALGTSETITTLPDGNRIVRQNTVRLWRDSDGRTRAEYSLSSIGGSARLPRRDQLHGHRHRRSRDAHALHAAARRERG